MFRCAPTSNRSKKKTHSMPFGVQKTPLVPPFPNRKTSPRWPKTSSSGRTPTRAKRPDPPLGHGDISLLVKKKSKEISPLMMHYLYWSPFLKVSPLPSPLKGKLRPAFKNGVPPAVWISTALPSPQPWPASSKKKIRSRDPDQEIYPPQKKRFRILSRENRFFFRWRPIRSTLS